jgi:aryl-alcohol dehydrogenase-like predicted oxidoreductase
MLPIPGAARLPHLEDNCAAATLRLTDEQVARLDAVATVTAQQPVAH